MLRVRFVSAHGSAHADYFPDSLLGIICAQARRLGHDAARLRLHYHGRDPAQDDAIRQRFVAWLRQSAPQVIFFDRLFDVAPLEAYRAIAPDAKVVLLTRGDSVSPMAGVDYLIGATAGLERDRTRRTPTPGELCRSSVDLLAALEDGDDDRSVPGVSRMSAAQILFGAPSTRAPLPRPFAPVLESDVIAPGDAPPIERHTLFGNAGCPYGQDPLKQAHFAQLTLPTDRPMARLGCAFCCMGGDYDARPDEEVIEEVVEQACWLAKHVPDLRELVLEDQAPLRYLGRVLERCAERGAPNLRWLFASRSDALLRQGTLLEQALSTATRTGAELELYLTGFESFCDAELKRFNKGVDVQTQLAAVERCRELRRLHPRHFGFTRARGHSLVLWSPWTTPEDLGESLEQIRGHGLCELFDELGKNRLRLYEDLPLYWAARRDHALLDDWQQGDEGSARSKGYNTERPWRFLDERTRLVYALAEALRARLGAQGEVAQLRAAVEYAQETSVEPAQAVAQVLGWLDALDAQIEPLLGHERDQPPRAHQQQATPVLFTGPCNDGCRECPQGDVHVDGAELLRRVDEEAAAGHALLFAGREPTLHPSFPAALGAARSRGAQVGVVSNGRRFAQRGFTLASARAGLSAVSVKLFAATAPAADSRARAPGAHDQALSGIRQLEATGRFALELRVPLSRSSLSDYADFAPLARRLGVPQLRAELSLDGLGLRRLASAAEALAELRRRCIREGVALEVSPSSAGERLFQRMPAR